MIISKPIILTFAKSDSVKRPYDVLKVSRYTDNQLMTKR